MLVWDTTTWSLRGAYPRLRFGQRALASDPSLSQAETLVPDASYARLCPSPQPRPGQGDALDSQLHRDAGISHYEYQALAMLSQGPTAPCE